MRIATVMSDEHGRTDRVLAEVAAALMAEGRRVVGVVQTNTDRRAAATVTWMSGFCPPGR